MRIERDSTGKRALGFSTKEKTGANDTLFLIKDMADLNIEGAGELVEPLEKLLVNVGLKEPVVVAADKPKP